MELTTPSIKSRLGEFCIKTKDGRTYELQGTFQNPNNSKHFFIIFVLIQCNHRVLKSCYAAEVNP